MSTKSERWTLRVTPDQDTIVRRVLRSTGMSLNEYVVSCAVSSATNDLANRPVFAISHEKWEELQDILDRPPASDPKIRALFVTPSALESE